TYWLLKGRFEEDEVRLLAAELGGALGFLHDLGIVHRDLKIRLVLGHLRLSDFGLSRHLDRGGRAFTVCGTIQYMAPEVLSGGPYGHAADWWSLGILLFSLVAGESRTTSALRSVSSNYILSPPEGGQAFSNTVLFLSSLIQLLCKSPASRLRDLQRFKMQAFFRGASFDSYLLQKTPVKFILELGNHPDWESNDSSIFLTYVGRRRVYKPRPGVSAFKV
uniref:Ribosomal protein S6 kinase related a n=1 Tax=Fundulus heteroclitus TaxID=8078 RepID=A0A3Q2TZZ8_FUNHE